jgi:vacuolar protein sorting-associated protein 13B
MSSLLSGLVQRIINRYLQKWLKNVTTEHATIWGGEMVFKNVELRLDVLQEELGLPLVFTRGFIQELRVYIPLASLLRESIKFTLTNLEVVASTPTQTSVRAKTRANKGAGHRNSKMSPGHGPTPRGRAHIEEGDKENQPSWMHSVVQRVLQNIGVEVRNLVFKYNTDSYVSSVSWKSLSLTSSNSSWEPIFASPEGETRAIYKKLSVDDITWCLDAVDPSGKTSYQTPLFNRETLAVRTIIRLLPEGDVSQHEPYQLPALQIDVLVPHLLVTVSERQVTLACARVLACATALWPPTVSTQSSEFMREGGR